MEKYGTIVNITNIVVILIYYLYGVCITQQMNICTTKDFRDQKFKTIPFAILLFLNNPYYYIKIIIWN
jgi:hypothetical protein